MLLLMMQLRSVHTNQTYWTVLQCQSSVLATKVWGTLQGSAQTCSGGACSLRLSVMDHSCVGFIYSRGLMASISSGNHTRFKFKTGTIKKSSRMHTTE